MSSLGSRQDILGARDNIERHFQHCNQQHGTNNGELSDDSYSPWMIIVPNTPRALDRSLSFSPTWVHTFSNGNMDMVVQFHDSTEARGVANALMRLIERHGIEHLQRVGVACHGSSEERFREQCRSMQLTLGNPSSLHATDRRSGKGVQHPHEPRSLWLLPE